MILGLNWLKYPLITIPVIAALVFLSSGARAQTPAAKPATETPDPNAQGEQLTLAADGEAAEFDALPGEREQGSVGMDELDLGQPPQQTGAANPFFRDSTLTLQLRNYYFHRQRFDNSHSEAWAQGGWIAFKSGYLADRLAFGAAVYGSFPLVAPENLDGTGLLQDDQDPYVVLGQAYGELRIVDGLQLNFGRKEYNTPFINIHDVRMTPKTFQGMTLTGKRAGRADGSEWRYGGGYIYKYKDWTETHFDYMSEGLGLDTDRGVITAGANYSTPRWSVGGINYLMDDVLNIIYTEGSYGWKFTPVISLKVSGQFVDQRSLGEDLLTGEGFDVQQIGVKADLGIQAATITLALTDMTAGGENMRSPWGGYPGYTSVQFGDFNRSGETAFMIKAGYDFTALGATGLSAYALWVHGWNRDVDGVFNEDEWDLNLQWTAPKESKMKGFAARVRYAHITQQGNDEETDDFRVILNYNFAIR
jgi:hypothetical protein